MSAADMRVIIVRCYAVLSSYGRKNAQMIRRRRIGCRPIRKSARSVSRPLRRTADASEFVYECTSRTANPSHMTCKKCKWEFCWVCMGPWSEHGNSWYQCNRFEEKGGIDARDAQAKSRMSLERYLHVSPHASAN